MSSCTGTCMSVRCEPTTVFRSFHLRSYRGMKHSRGTSMPACLMQKPTVKKYLTIGTVYVLSHSTEFRNILLTARGRESAYSWANGQEN